MGPQPKQPRGPHTCRLQATVNPIRVRPEAKTVITFYPIIPMVGGNKLIESSGHYMPSHHCNRPISCLDNTNFGHCSELSWILYSIRHAVYLLSTLFG